MHRLNLLLLSFLFVAPLVVANHDAMAGSCVHTKSGKCPAQKKITHSRSDFTVARREKLMEEARNMCKKKYGAGSTVYKLDYYKWRVTCND